MPEHPFLIIHPLDAEASVLKHPFLSICFLDAASAF
jgi:hypothetical protein